ncbi:MAG TPA: sensor histidine kinase [Bryobacteraceae bacterium]|nr:sensor histidine kinase [Bryobacteraceae bacterium]
MLRRRSILLALAFASLLLITGGAAFEAWRGAGNAQSEVAALHRSHLEAGDALASIRANVFLSGILTRDYLLDTDPSHDSRYAGQFDDIRSSTASSFLKLAESETNQPEKAAIERLRLEVNSYWDPTQIALDWSPEEKVARRSAVLQERVRHREEIVELATQLEQLMSANFTAERARITSADNRFRSSLAWTAGLALLMGVGIAAVTVVHIAALERKSAEADAELRRLSAQIRVAQEQERRMLSRELHDQAGQMLTGLRMELASISYGAGEEEFNTRVTHAKGIVEQTLRIVRNIATMLRPSMLDDLGLAAALGWLVRDVKRSTGIEVQADVDAALDNLPDTECTCIYRVVQEAMTNAARHSGASRIDVVIGFSGVEAVGSVTDNGQGFEATEGRRSGLGLIGMEERLRELGGNLRVISSSGTGTRIEFRVPGTAAPSYSYAENG